MAVVEFRGISKQFEGTRALDHVDLGIRDGELLVLLGPSGSGKTTLMRLCAGLEAATEGAVLIDGAVVNDLAPREREIAMVFQSYALYPHKTVFGNIAFPLQVQRLPRDEIRKKVEWAAGLLRIGHLLERRPSQLSGGEQQRVAIARAMVRKPKVFLMDEPLSNLDAQVRDFARGELKRFQRELGVTTIFVTHDQVEAMGLGDRIAVLHDGSLSQLGTPDEVYDDPADTFVAGFVGTPPMNLLERGDRIVGFRPEAFAPPELVGSADTLRLRFHVDLAENLGSYCVVSGTVDAAPVRSRLTGRHHFPPGEILDFAVRTADLYFFDRKTGRRIRE